MTQPELWIFAYGSLMWRPDFAFAEARRARLPGWRRRFCIVSRFYRGTNENPGLLLGLDRGGSCDGVAYRIDEADTIDVVAYLRRREQISGVYRETCLNIELAAGGSREVRRALVFLAEPAHPSFVPFLPLSKQARILANATGSSGTNLDYFANTWRELRRLEIREPEIERLAALLGNVRLRARAHSRLHARAKHPTRMIKGWPRGPKYRLSEVKRFAYRARLNSVAAPRALQ